MELGSRDVDTKGTIFEKALSATPKSQIIAMGRFSHIHNLRSIPSGGAGCRAGPAEKQNSVGADLEAVRYIRHLLMVSPRAQTSIHSTNTS